MNNKIIASIVMAISLAAAGSAAAQNRDHHRNDRGSNAHSQNKGGGWDRGHKHHAKQRNKQARPHNNGYHKGRGAGPRHNLYKGRHIPHEYRNRQYVVNDWRGHHLHSPPRGYQWVQTGPDYVLIAVATGIIAQIVFSN